MSMMLLRDWNGASSENFYCQYQINLFDTPNKSMFSIQFIKQQLLWKALFLKHKFFAIL